MAGHLGGDGLDCLFHELAGTEEKLEAFTELAKSYGIAELARTGVIAMPRGLQKDAKEKPAPTDKD